MSGVSTHPRKRSIWLGRPIRDMLVRTNQENVSGAINTAIARYTSVLAQSLPRFTLAEWCAICDACQGREWETASLGSLWQVVAEREDLGEKWTVNAPALVDALRSLPYAAAVAVVDATERFWASDPERGGWDAAIRRVLGKDALSKTPVTPRAPSLAPRGARPASRTPAHPQPTWHCDRCARPLTADQVHMAMADAGLDLSAGDAGEHLRFCCSTYTFPFGCKGNDPAQMAYWSTK